MECLTSSSLVKRKSRMRLKKNEIRLLLKGARLVERNFEKSQKGVPAEDVVDIREVIKKLRELA